MRNNTLLTIYIFFLTLFSIFINSYYTYKAILLFLVEKNPYLLHIIISNISLNLSWVFIYIWFAFKPFERKNILLIAVFSMFLSNILYNYTIEFQDFLINFSLLMLIILFYLYGYFLLKKDISQNTF